MSIICENTRRAKSGYCLSAWQQTVQNVSAANPDLPWKQRIQIASAAYREANPNLPQLTPEQKAQKAADAKESKRIRREAFELG